MLLASFVAPPFGRFVDSLVIDPPPAMARNFIGPLNERRGHFRVPLERHRDAEDRQREVAALELAQEPPRARARAVFVDRLHRHVARGIRRRPHDLGEKLLGGRIAVEHRALSAFLVVQDELDGDARATWPTGVRRVGTITS